MKQASEINFLLELVFYFGPDNHLECPFEPRNLRYDNKHTYKFD